MPQVLNSGRNTLLLGGLENKPRTQKCCWFFMPLTGFEFLN
jgi:hypothetical protein